MRYATVIVLIVIFIQSCLTCQRPDEILAIEKKCLDENSGLIEKIHRTATGFVGYAKRKIGIVTPEEEKGEKEYASPQKCEYYQCLLMKLSLIKENNLPGLASVMQLLGKYSESQESDKIEACFPKLSAMPVQILGKNITLYEEDENESPDSLFTEINGEVRKITIKSDKKTPKDENIATRALENVCDMSAILINCLSSHMDSECKIFKYP